MFSRRAKMNSIIKIGNISITSNSPVFIVAELSANHNGSLKTAIETVKGAKRAGADGIKLQTYTPDTITLNHKLEDFKVKQGTIWDGRYLYELYTETYTPWNWHPDLFRAAEDVGLICFSTPFDKSSVDFLEEFNVPAYKIASFEITDISLIEYVASKGKPVIISLGIANEEDISLALGACSKVGNDQIILLKCTSSYPASPTETNAVMIKDLANRYNILTGLSDHTLGISVPVVATVFGARIIEKHFILDRTNGGPDSSFSLNEKEFREMVEAIRIAEQAIGTITYSITESQKKSRELSRSLYVSEPIKVGEEITEMNVRSVRPGYGLHPKYFKDIIGKKANRNLSPGTRMCFDFLEI
jgi:pseudaminic acid synthase